MHMNKIILALTIIFSIGCGISPGVAGEELQHQANDTDSWCGWKPELPSVEDANINIVYDDASTLDEVEKYTGYPSGFGVTSTFGCFVGSGAWSGDYCSAPEFREQRVRLFQEAHDAAWFKNSTDEYGVLATQLNNADWDVTRVTNNTYTTGVRTSTNHPNGYLGYAIKSDYTLWLFQDHQFTEGDFWTYGHCEATLYRTAIEANNFYQAASSAQQVRYLKNLWQHEMEHCFGQAHLDGVVNVLMSTSYTFPGPMFDKNLNHNATQQGYYEDYVSIAE